MSSSSIVIIHSCIETLKKVAKALVKYKTVCIFDKNPVTWCTENNPLQEGTRLVVHRAPQTIVGAYLSKSMVLKIVSEYTLGEHDQFAVL